VKRDEDGLLFFVGRRDAMIKSAGNRISPQEIEDAALATGLVADAVAFGVPDTKLGQAVHLVVRGEGQEEALATALKRDLPSFMQPHRIEWRAKLPLNPNGKIDRTALYREISEGGSA
jgi:acyl-coenzyme A synthetase/AMP-(fatty) acid ligase